MTSLIIIIITIINNINIILTILIIIIIIIITCVPSMLLRSLPTKESPPGQYMVNDQTIINQTTPMSTHETTDQTSRWNRSSALTHRHLFRGVYRLVSPGLFPSHSWSPSSSRSHSHPRSSSSTSSSRRRNQLWPRFHHLSLTKPAWRAGILNQQYKPPYLPSDTPSHIWKLVTYCFLEKPMKIIQILLFWKTNENQTHIVFLSNQWKSVRYCFF